MTALDAIVAQECRAAVEREAHGRAGDVAGLVIDKALGWADRAAKATASMTVTDAEIVRAVRRYARRRLRAGIRAAIGRDAPDSLRDAALDRAGLVFTARLLARRDDGATTEGAQ